MSKARGSALEALVRKSAEAQGLRGLRKRGPVYTGAVGRGGRAKGGRVTGSGQLDFSGNVGPLAVTFDAKSTELKTRFPLDKLKRSQVVTCKRRHEEGSIAFFLVEFVKAAGGPRYYALPWPVLKSFWERFTAIAPGSSYVASIPLEVFELHCPDVELAGKHLDLVGVVRTLEGQLRGEVGA